MKRIVTISCSFTAACLNWCAAGEFRNLGFEEYLPESMSIIGRSEQSITNALPGWSVLYGSEPVDGPLWINQFRELGDADLAWIALGSRAWFSYGIVEAKWALYLEHRLFSWRLEQTGTVPPNTKWLTYRTLQSEMQVEINGEVIPPLNRQTWAWGPARWEGISMPATNLLYDISKYAGQEVALALVGPILGQEAYVDSIQFVGPQPSLTVEHSGQEVLLSWPADSSSYILQMSDSPAAAGIWERVWILPVIKGDQQTVKVQIANERKFFRLNVGSYIEMTW